MEIYSIAQEGSLQNELDVLNSLQNCNADQSNRFYGDRGALFCLLNKGDVAILGLKDLNGKFIDMLHSTCVCIFLCLLIQRPTDKKNLNLTDFFLEHAKDLTIDPQYYQVICRNGSLADHTGFDIDSDCALATYIDSELNSSVLIITIYFCISLFISSQFRHNLNNCNSGEIVIKANSTKREGIVNALLSFDKYFQIDPDFKMYGTFDGHKNVLFNVRILID